MRSVLSLNHLRHITINILFVMGVEILKLYIKKKIRNVPVKYTT